MITPNFGMRMTDFLVDNYVRSCYNVMGPGNGPWPRGGAARWPGKETEMIRLMRTYVLVPNDSHKSFYKKANVRVYSDGTEVLRSYATDVMSRDADGNFHRHWGGWSATTGRHIAAFAGINKAAWNKMDVEPICWNHSYEKISKIA